MGVVHSNHHNFRPIGATGYGARFNFEGVIVERGGERNYGYTQVFRNGSLETTKANIVREHEGSTGIPGHSIEKEVFGILPLHIEGLHQIGVPTPLIIMISLEGVGGAFYRVQPNLFHEDDLPIDRPDLFLPECILGDYGSELDYHRAVRPAFDTLWNVVGHPHDRYFNEEGRWDGNWH